MSPRRRRSSRRPARGHATRGTPAPARAPVSAIRPATASCCTAGTRPTRTGHAVIQPQRVDFIAVPTQDRDRAEQFYARDARADEEPALDGELGRVRDRQHDARARRARADRARVRATAVGSIAFRVPDVEEAKAKLEAAGRRVHGEIVGLRRLSRRRVQRHRGQRTAVHHRYAPYRRRDDALMQITRVDYIGVPTQDIAAGEALLRGRARAAAKRQRDTTMGSSTRRRT